MLVQSDAFNIPLADESVHCCITSPPYWGLRKYSGEQGQEPLGLEPTSDCGLGGFIGLRSDLTDDQKEYVRRHLRALGILDV